MGLEEPQGHARQRTLVSRGEEAGRRPPGWAGRSVAQGCGGRDGRTHWGGGAAGVFSQSHQPLALHKLGNA